MPPRGRAAQTDPLADESTETESASSGGHVVLVDMLTYSVPGRRPGTIVGARARKGAHIDLDPDLNDVGYLEDLKAVAPDDGTKYKRTTAKALAEAAGGREDPVPVPDNLFDVPEDEQSDLDLDDEDDEAEDNSTPADDE